MPQQLEPETVHFYVKGVPVVWCAAILDHLTQVATAQAAVDLTWPRRDGTVRPVPITTAWLLRQDQGRQVLCKTLHGRKNDSAKHRILQMLARAFQGNGYYGWSIYINGNDTTDRWL